MVQWPGATNRGHMPHLLPLALVQRCKPRRSPLAPPLAVARYRALRSCPLPWPALTAQHQPAPLANPLHSATPGPPRLPPCRPTLCPLIRALAPPTSAAHTPRRTPALRGGAILRLADHGVPHHGAGGALAALPSTSRAKPPSWGHGRGLKRVGPRPHA